MPHHYSILITGGVILDGSLEAEPRSFSLGIVGDTITFLGDLPDDETAEITFDHKIDASGLIVCPGFIDTHTHDDAGLYFEGGEMRPKVSQGVTTVVVGNCGVSMSPLYLPDSLELVAPLPLVAMDRSLWRYSTSEEYVRALEKTPATVNSCFLIGHITLRLDAMQDATQILERPATGAEIDHMRKRLEDSMIAGAIGFSTGLAYAPNSPAPTEEVISLAKVASNYGGIYATHMRDEGAKIQSSVEEALKIGMEADIPVVISHFKSAGIVNHGKVQAMFKLIDEAPNPKKVMVDVYPYTASSTILTEKHIEGAKKVVITWSETQPEASGRDLHEFAKERNQPMKEVINGLTPAGAIYWSMDEADVNAVIKYPRSMIGSDGLFFDSFPHPRLYGTFPRVLGHYVREKHILDLKEAIHKMTLLPATTFHLDKRGLLKTGYYADIVIVDPSRVLDEASFSEPKKIASGIEYVITNGQVVFEKGMVMQSRPGRLCTFNKRY